MKRKEGYKKIQLTKGYFALVDESDFEEVSKFKWFADIKKGVVYARRNANKQNEYEYLHRFILKQKDKLIKVDHIDHDGLNCQRYNLRNSTQKQNLLNRKSGKGSSVFLGVSFFPHGKRVKRWVAEYNDNGRHTTIGYFHTEMEAAKARDAAVSIVHGFFRNS